MSPAQGLSAGRDPNRNLNSGAVTLKMNSFVVCSTSSLAALALSARLWVSYNSGEAKQSLNTGGSGVDIAAQPRFVCRACCFEPLFPSFLTP